MDFIVIVLIAGYAIVCSFCESCDYFIIECNYFLGEPFIVFIIEAILSIWGLREFRLSLKPKLKIYKKKLPVISFSDTSIAIPFLISEPIKYKSIKYIQLKKSFFSNTLIIEPIDKSKLLPENNWCKTGYDGQEKSLVWTIPFLKSEYYNLQEVLERYTKVIVLD